jgi:hypothetical protein
MPHMALLAWDDVSWPDFVAGLEGFRDHFTTERANRTYADFLDRPKGPDYATELVRLLNRWACRLSSDRAPVALEAWLRARAADLEEVERMTILDVRVRDHADELGALHDDLIREMRAAGVSNMADAAASKALHLLQPRLFVMWDKEIRRSAPEGYGTYLLQMHALADRLSEQSPADDVEAYLHELLGYEKRKTLAKYVDEYNWFEAVGRGQLAARSR